jgi:polyisoprenoid-binding protein YceI
MKKIIVFTTAVFLLSSFVATETLWTQDKMHSQLNFSATHFGISHIEGRFQTFAISMKSEKQDFSDAQIEMTADIKSINTEVVYRDNDLRSSNWFDADKFPVLTFKSTSFTQVKGKMYKLKGYLTIHGISKMVEFDASLNGWAVTLSKKNTAGFTIKGKIHRSDFNVGGAASTTGVSNDIMVWSNVEIGKN